MLYYISTSEVTPAGEMGNVFPSFIISFRRG